MAELQQRTPTRISGPRWLLTGSRRPGQVNVSEAHVCGALAAVEAWTHDLLPHLDLADAAQALAPPPPRARILGSSK